MQLVQWFMMPSCLDRAESILETAKKTQKLMTEASRIILNGFELKTNAEVLFTLKDFLKSEEKKCGICSSTSLKKSPSKTCLKHFEKF